MWHYLLVTGIWPEHYHHRSTPAVGNGKPWTNPFLIGNLFIIGQLSMASFHSQPNIAKADAAAADYAATNGTAWRLRWASLSAVSKNSGWWLIFWGFHKWGHPKKIHFRLGFSLINHPFLGTSIYRNPKWNHTWLDDPIQLIFVRVGTANQKILGNQQGGMTIDFEWLSMFLFASV